MKKLGLLKASPILKPSRQPVPPDGGCDQAADQTISISTDLNSDLELQRSHNNNVNCPNTDNIVDVNINNKIGLTNTNTNPKNATNLCADPSNGTNTNNHNGESTFCEENENNFNQNNINNLADGNSTNGSSPKTVPTTRILQCSLGNKMKLTQTKKNALNKLSLCGSGIASNHISKGPVIQPETNDLAPNEMVSDLESRINTIKKEKEASLSPASVKEDSADGRYIEIEEGLMSDVGQIKDSISKLLDERKNLQTQHRQWIEDRKKKIVEIRKETDQLSNPNQVYPSNTLLFNFFDSAQLGPTKNRTLLLSTV